jgi:hypothetical protein
MVGTPRCQTCVSWHSHGASLSASDGAKLGGVDEFDG